VPHKLTHLKYLVVFVDDLSLGSYYFHSEYKHTHRKCAKSVGLKINQEKTKVMELLSNEEKNMVVDDYVFEKVKEF